MIAALVAVVLGLCVAGGAAANGQTVVSARCNIFGTAAASAPAPGGGGGGLPPARILLSNPTARFGVQFTVTGSVSIDGTAADSCGPDGGSAETSTDVLPYGLLSGIRHSSKTMFLVGVFMPASTPRVEPTPPTLDFSDDQIGTGFTAIAPRVRQVFFIGDGLDAAGDRQTFDAPADYLCELYLGFAEAFDGSTVSGLPGYYADNTGSLSVTVVTVAIHCGSADFNHDGITGADADIEAFFACLAGNCCATCDPHGADFNGDGDTATDADIEAFFRVLAGGSC